MTFGTPPGAQEVRGRRRGFPRAGVMIAVLALAFLTGCATAPRPGPAIPFTFNQDTFNYANGLVWVYQYDQSGKWTTEPRVPRPDYSQHCFVMARSCLQFLQHARFDPDQPRLVEADYRSRIREVVGRNPRRQSPPAKRIVFPGFRNLRELSAVHESLLKEECGGAWQSYVQRGHWRMVFPFSRKHQFKTAQALQEILKRPSVAVLHVVRFPQLTINHALLAYDVRETDTGLRILIYDPNTPEEPASLTYDSAERTFHFAPNEYFPGGRVDVYQVYHHWAY